LPSLSREKVQPGWPSAQRKVGGSDLPFSAAATPVGGEKTIVAMTSTIAR